MQIMRSKNWWPSRAESEPEVPIGAGAEATNLASVYTPMLAERFWRWAGYRYRLTELPEETATMPGWAMTHIWLHFSFWDRVRILLSGNVKIDVRQAMSESVETVVSAASIMIVAPGEKP